MYFLCVECIFFQQWVTKFKEEFRNTSHSDLIQGPYKSRVVWFLWNDGFDMQLMPAKVYNYKL